MPARVSTMIDHRFTSTAAFSSSLNEITDRSHRARAVRVPFLHLAGNALIFADRRSQRYSHTPDFEPADYSDRDRSPAISSCHLQDGHDVDDQQRGTAGALSRKALYRPHHRKSVAQRDDRVGGWSPCCSCSCTSSSSNTHLVPDGQPRSHPRPVPYGDGVFRQPVWVAFYVVCTLIVGLLCGTASPVFSVDRIRSPCVYAPYHADGNRRRGHHRIGWR